MKIAIITSGVLLGPAVQEGYASFKSDATQYVFIKE